MTFYLSKFLWYLFNPFNFILYLLILSVILNFFKFLKFSKIILYFTFLLFFITGVLPTGSYLFYLLEKNYHDKINLPEKVDGIIVLSGATNPFLTKEHDQITLNNSVERLTESIQLIKKYPEAKVFFAGGSGSMQHTDLRHSDVAKKFYESLDVNMKNIFFENESRNTYENIAFAQEKFSPNRGEKWVLVTSAFHLRRAVYIGEKLGWEFIPYPTDYRQPKKFKWIDPFNFFDFFDNLRFFQESSHEWIGIIYYYLMGRSSRIL